MELWDSNSKELEEIFKSFGFLVDVVEVESTEILPTNVNALEKSNLSKFQSIFVEITT